MVLSITFSVSVFCANQGLPSASIGCFHCQLCNRKQKSIRYFQKLTCEAVSYDFNDAINCLLDQSIGPSRTYVRGPLWTTGSLGTVGYLRYLLYLPLLLFRHTTLFRTTWVQARYKSTGNRAGRIVYGDTLRRSIFFFFLRRLLNQPTPFDWTEANC